MKVKRYQYGVRNVDQLESAARSIMPVARKASLAGAPYESIAKAADSITGDIKRYAEHREREIYATDKGKMAMDVKNTTEALRRLDIEARQQNYSAQEYQEFADEIVRGFVQSGVDNISDRNRQEFLEQYGTYAANWAATSALSSHEIHRNQTSEAFQINFNELVSQRDWTGANAMLEVARRDDTRTLMTNEMIAENEKLLSDQAEAEDLFVGYAEARAEGKEEEWIASKNWESVSDGALDAFHDLRTRHDYLTEAAEREADMRRSMRMSSYLNVGITASTTVSDLERFFVEEGIDDFGTQNTFYNRLRSVKEDRAYASGIFGLNPASARDRTAMDSKIPLRTADGEETSEQQRAESAISIAVSDGVAPKSLDSYFNKIGHELDDPQYFMSGAENYHVFMRETNGLPLSVETRARIRLDMYHSLRESGLSPQKAAAITVKARLSETDEEFSANVDAFTDTNYGSEDGKSPQDMVVQGINDKLDSEEAVNLGLAVGEAGNRPPRMPRPMRNEVMKVSENVYGYTRSEEAAIDTGFNIILSQGWKATGVNANVPVGDGEVMGFEYMKNPPIRGADYTRVLLKDDVEGRKFLINGDWKELDQGQIQLGEGVIRKIDGKDIMHWPMMYRGMILYDENGPADFIYPMKDVMDDEEVSAVIAAHEAARKRAGMPKVDPDLEL